MGKYLERVHVSKEALRRSLSRYIPTREDVQQRRLAAGAVTATWHMSVGVVGHGGRAASRTEGDVQKHELALHRLSSTAERHGEGASGESMYMHRTGGTFDSWPLIVTLAQRVLPFSFACSFGCSNERVGVCFLPCLLCFALLRGVYALPFRRISHWAFENLLDVSSRDQNMNRERQ